MQDFSGLFYSRSALHDLDRPLINPGQVGIGVAAGIDIRVVDNTVPIYNATREKSVVGAGFAQADLTAFYDVRHCPFNGRLSGCAVTGNCQPLSSRSTDRTENFVTVNAPW